MSKLENKILDALEEIRPFLVKDGGDISLESVTKLNCKKLNYTVLVLTVKSTR